jgi:hypothetical protein
MIFLCLTALIGAQENVNIEESEVNEVVKIFQEEDNQLNKEIVENSQNNENKNEQNIGLIFSFSGFNEFRLGLGIFFGELGTDGHHPFGTDFGLLFEFNFKENIKYSRVYYHLTGGVSAMLLGGSMVIAFDNNDISVGFAPEIGIGLSTLFKMFYRYNFYINNRFNSYEVVFHLCLSKRN